MMRILYKSATGVLPASGVDVVNTEFLPDSMTVSLASSSASRKIELSNDGGANYFTWPYDLSTTNMLLIIFKAKIGVIKFTGAPGDTYGITTGNQ